MAEQPHQTKQNHVRIDPVFHYFLSPLLFLLIIWFGIHAARRPGTESVAQFLLVLALLLTAVKARTNALKVQDRVIRLEERLRLATLSPGDHPAIASRLTEQQLIALRFASDREFPALAGRAARENLTSKQIKEAIQEWRPDHWRV